jgi:hypothetical protein
MVALGLDSLEFYDEWGNASKGLLIRKSNAPSYAFYGRPDPDQEDPRTTHLVNAATRPFKQAGGHEQLASLPPLL